MIDFFVSEFHNETALFQSLGGPGQAVYFFYALAAVLCIRPHLRQIQRYRHGEAGKGDFCHRAQYEGIFWRLAPLLYSVVINSKLLGISVAIDMLGRLLTIKEAHRAERRFKGETTREAEALADAKTRAIRKARDAGILLSEGEDGSWLAIVPTWTHRDGAMVNAGLNRCEKHYPDLASMERDLPGLVAIYGNTF